MKLAPIARRLQEAYVQIPEIDKLCTEIFKKIADSNYSVVKRLVPGDFFRAMEAVPTVFLVELRYIPTTGFHLLKDFIENSGCAVNFRALSKLVGVNYDDKTKTVKINIGSDSSDLSYEIYRQNTTNDGKLKHNNMTDAEAKSVMVAAFGELYRSALAHELTHAFDAFRSKTKKVDKDGQPVYGYTGDRKSQRYYQDRDSKGIAFFNNPQAMSRYYKLPHEYWARFTQAILDMDFSGKSLRQVTNDFIQKFVGWDVVGDSAKGDYTNAQKRLLKALSDYYYLQKDGNIDQPAKRASSGFANWEKGGL
jgi:hypothetical protein